MLAQNLPTALVRFIDGVKSSSLRFLAPGLVVAVAAASVIVNYTPLTYVAPEPAVAQSSELGDPITADESKKGSAANPSKKSSAASGVDASALKDGTYTGYDECAEDGVFDYYLALDVTVSGGKVTNVGNVRGVMANGSGGSLPGSYDTRNNEYIGWAANGKGGATGVVDQIMSDAKQGTITNSIDTISGATFSSDSILRAYHNALKKAQGKSAPVASSSKKATAKKSKKAKKAKAKSSVGSKDRLADGKFTGYDRCTEEDIFDYFLALDVTVKDGKVTKVDNVRPTMKDANGKTIEGEYDTANDVYLKWAVDGRDGKKGVVPQIMAVEKKGKRCQSIDTISGATFSSKSILNAYYDALKISAKKAGSEVEVPKADESKSDNSSSSEEEKKPAVTPSTDVPTVDEDALIDGDYTAYAFCEDTANPSAYFPYYIGVTINVAGGKVASITDVFGDKDGVVDSKYKYSAGQNKTYLDRAIKGYGRAGTHPGVKEQVNNALAAGTMPTKIDTLSGATYSSISIWDAFIQAVKDAQAAADAEKAKQHAASADDAASGDAAADETGGEGGSSETTGD